MIVEIKWENFKDNCLTRALENIQACSKDCRPENCSEIKIISKADICREFYEKLMERLDYDCVFTRQEIINNAVMVFEEMEQGE